MFCGNTIMALRSLSGLACRTARLGQRGIPLSSMNKLSSAVSKIQVSSFHIHRPLFVLDKEVKNKRELVKMAVSNKLEEGTIGNEGVDLSGLTEAGITIPTLETHEMVIDGVRYAELPIVHIHSSPNNTIMTVTNHTGKDLLGQNSCGREGFKNTKKSTTVAAQATGLSLGTQMMKRGIQTVRVVVKGLGTGRLPSIKGLQMAGMKVVSISDRTTVLHDGPRPRKARRL